MCPNYTLVRSWLAVQPLACKKGSKIWICLVQIMLSYLILWLGNILKQPIWHAARRTMGDYGVRANSPWAIKVHKLWLVISQVDGVGVRCDVYYFAICKCIRLSASQRNNAQEWLSGPRVVKVDELKYTIVIQMPQTVPIKCIPARHGISLTGG